MIYLALTILAAAALAALLPAPRPRHNWPRAFAESKSRWLEAELNAELWRRMSGKAAKRETEPSKVVTLKTKQEQRA